ncbi:MAG: kelch repeat-containing protein, partial [Planctomycetota bacterium]
MVSARFLDENILNGLAEDGEIVILTFDRPVQVAQPARTGIQLHPEGHRLGNYRIEAGPQPHQLQVVIGGGECKLVAPGIYLEDSDSTGLSLDYDQLQLTDSRGRRLRGKDGPVDIAVTPHLPAQPRKVEWVDTDRSLTVTEGDTLRLTFLRKMRLSDKVRRFLSHVPEGMFFLPVEGDRLDDGRIPSELRISTDPYILEVVLGSNPSLTVWGEFYPRPVGRTPGSPSGLAIHGTRIQPHQGLFDPLGIGVMSEDILDIQGDCDPFEVLPFPEPIHLKDHTATKLQDGRVLVLGGIVTRPGREAQCSQGGYIYNEDDDESPEWDSEIQMKWPRAGHTATYFLGADGIKNTRDDFVLVFGGWDGNKPLNSMEVFLPYSNTMLPIYPKEYPTP